MRNDWRDLNTGADKGKSKSSDAALIAKLKRTAESPQANHDQEKTGSDDLDYVVSKHYVHKRKGKWDRFPPEVDGNAEQS